MQIGLFGGAFNPPHLAHLVVAESARVLGRLDRVLWIPTHIPPHKSAESFASAADRLEMVRLAIDSNSDFEISTVEIDRDDVSYMIDTVAILKQQFPDADFSLIMGGDSLEQFHSWYQFERLLREVKLIAFERPEHHFDRVSTDILNATTVLPDTPSLSLSSSDIRARVAQGLSIRYLVPDTVDLYIRRRELYQVNTDSDR